MRTLYQASNSLEAHMLADLLKQQGFHAHIAGEHLQGAMGELPAGGLVRLLVDEADYEGARRVIADWEAVQPEAGPALQAPRPRGRPWLVFLAGLAVGMGLSLVYGRAPVAKDGVDHNRDGVLDEVWTYAPNGTAISLRADRNLDGKVDYRGHHDARGVQESAEADDNFDGRFETLQGFRAGQLAWTETDTDADGHADLLSHFESGVLRSRELRRPDAPGPYRREAYRLGRLQHADVDQDGDGELDLRVFYGALGLETATERLTLRAGRTASDP